MKHPTDEIPLNLPRLAKAETLEEILLRLSGYHAKTATGNTVVNMDLLMADFVAIAKVGKVPQDAFLKGVVRVWDNIELHWNPDFPSTEQ